MGDAFEPILHPANGHMEAGSCQIPEPQTLGFVPFRLPLSSTATSLRQVGETESLLVLCWLLTLYRYSAASDLQFSWGYNDINSGTKDNPESVLSLSISDFPVEKADPISIPLERLKIFREQVKSRYEVLEEATSGFLFVSNGSRSNCSKSASVDVARRSEAKEVTFNS